MNLKLLPFKATLNKAYQKVKPSRSDIELFKTNLARLLDRIDHEESEENAKNHLRDFLNDTWYKQKHLVNTKGRTDLVIHEDNSANSKAAVLFEVKRPKNAADMVTTTNLNAKAMHELMLYYLRERVEHQNSDIKYLVITNVYDWYIFEGAVFDRLFYQDKKLLKEYEKWRNGQKVDVTTDLFYKDIARPHLEALNEEVGFAHFNLKDFTKALRNDDPKDDNKLIPLFKIFSPPHLLRQSFANDSNTLNEGFYKELLYLIGLEEEKEGGKKLIRRCAPERRLPGSLLENTIATLEATERWQRVRGADKGLLNLQGLVNLSPTERKDELIFAIALELCITWMNRLLFLKLLEAQLVKYHNGDSQYRFLNPANLKDFDEVNELFFEVLAKTPELRAEYVQVKFRNVPYLNSSLFEISELEADTLFISNLKDRFRIAPMANTVLKDEKGKRQTAPTSVLDYLFAFLDAYDFASEGSEEIQEENKALINASVLGLIFEKINGYRDGSFFTPGFITMYMCRETVRRAVVQKFNQHYGIDCADFGDLCNYTAKLYKKEDVLAMNRLVNSLRICDPAVGSGHFLVSALNELLAVKSELGILADHEGNVLRGYAATVENDELVLTCNEGQDLFEYRVVETLHAPVQTLHAPVQTLHATSLRGAGKETQRVQETIFHEKQAIIENCLFGVDINPNSVKICRLRLWIELLKNTYYKGGTDAGGLETLPNIDINIKTGNSLISRFALDADLSKALKSVKYDINTYRRYVQEYHHATDKETKRGLLLLIDQIKGDFRTEIHRNDKLNKQKSKLAGELYNLTQQGSLFGMTEAEAKKRQAETDKISKELDKLEALILEAQENKIYENAFEWRFEFPEVLDAEGKFVGFDVVVGNPPYIDIKGMDKSFVDYLFENFATSSNRINLYPAFIELSHSLLRVNGQFGFINPNSILMNSSYEKIRELVFDDVFEIVKLPDSTFIEASVETILLFFEKDSKRETINVRLFGRQEEIISVILKERTIIEKAVWKESCEGKFNIYVNPLIQGILSKCQVGTIGLGEIADFSLGITPYDKYRGHNEEQIKNRVFHSDSKISDEFKPIISGGKVTPYYVDVLPDEFIKYGDWLGAAREERFFLEPRIIVRQIVSGNPLRIYAGYTEQPAYFTQVGFGIISNDANYENKYILALLNSKLLNYYHKFLFLDIEKEIFQKILIQNCKSLPIKVIDSVLKQPIIALVTQILAAKQADPQADTTALEREVDVLVYGLYGLGEEEINIIEGT